VPPAGLRARRAVAAGHGARSSSQDFLLTGNPLSVTRLVKNRIVAGRTCRPPEKLKKNFPV